MCGGGGGGGVCVGGGVWLDVCVCVGVGDGDVGGGAGLGVVVAGGGFGKASENHPPPTNHPRGESGCGRPKLPSCNCGGSVVGGCYGRGEGRLQGLIFAPHLSYMSENNNV